MSSGSDGSRSPNVEVTTLSRLLRLLNLQTPNLRPPLTRLYASHYGRLHLKLLLHSVEEGISAPQDSKARTSGLMESKLYLC